MKVKNKKMIPFLRKNNKRKTKQWHYNDICRWKKHRFSIEVEIKTSLEYRCTRFARPLIILFQTITLLKTILMLRVSKVFNTVAVVRSTVILLQCLWQGWCERMRVIKIQQLQEKTKKNHLHQQYQQKHKLMMIVMNKLLM